MSKQLKALFSINSELSTVEYSLVINTPALARAVLQTALFVNNLLD